jgi:2-oxoglutarate ferredoxin oxidoreductase subunit beta
MNSLITAFAKGIKISGISPAHVSVPSDILFEPEIIKQLGIDYFHTARGRAIAFGTGLKLANPLLKIVPFVGDIMTLGGNHFVHAGRRNMELLVICINNFVYKKIAGQTAPLVRGEFSPYSTFEEPFNIPHLGNSCGALYTARWTPFHTEELAASIAEAMHKRGLSVIEILAPGPNYYTSIAGVHEDIAQFYYDNAEIKNNEDPRNVGISADKKIIVGSFTNREKPPFIDNYNLQLSKVLGDKFTPYGPLDKNDNGGSDGGN